MKRLRGAAITGVIALAARLLVVLWAAPRFPAKEDGFYYDTLARRIADGHGSTWLWPDGAVTYAAHYPVGYPAMVGALYALFGKHVAVPMLLNAALGVAAAVAVHALVRRASPGPGEGRAMAAGLAVALHPALVPYTAAVMTEGITTSLLVVAAALATFAREPVPSRRAWAWRAAAALTLGVATLVRPQSIVLAPIVGLLSFGIDAPLKRRLTGAAAVLGLAVAVCLPWTARNCARMDRCALVSVNGGWNLLIGVGSKEGGWSPIEVPPECREVFAEAAKDTCFERAARAKIARAPGAWLALAPSKLRMTFDYFGAGPWYLHASNPAAFPERAKIGLATVETVVCRALLVVALVALARRERPSRARRAIGYALAAAGIVAALTHDGWIGYLALAALVLVEGWRGLARMPVALSFGAAVILATAATHAAFFGAGRYGLVVVPFVTAMAFVPRRVE